VYPCISGHVAVLPLGGKSEEKNRALSALETDDGDLQS
jgi:hypothetical protein